MRPADGIPQGSAQEWKGLRAGERCVDIEHKVAVVTGGAVRVGRAISLALAGERVRVCVHYGSSSLAAEETAADIRARGGSAMTVSADLREPAAAAKTIFDKACAEWGGVDILVNSAAVFEAGTLAETTGESWKRQFAINLEAPFCLCREFAGRQGQGRRGHLVNIVDWRATRPVSGHLAYTLTKSGLATMTRILAQELAPEIQVNAVAPGAILPPPGQDEHSFDGIAKQVPLGRSGSPDDVTRAVLYLLKSDFVTGEILHVTGGQQL